MGWWASEQNVGMDWTELGDTPLIVVTTRAPAVLKRYDSEHSYGGAHPSTTLHGVLRQDWPKGATSIVLRYLFWWRTMLVWNVNLKKYIDFKTSKSLARIIFSQNELNLIDEEGVSGCVTKTKTVCLQTWGRPDIWLCYRQIDRLFILIVSRLGDCHNLLFGTACLKDMRINVYKWLLKTMMSSSE